MHVDYRRGDTGAAYAALAAGRPLRVLQWNIERGYQLEAIKAALAAADADVLLLQEIDVGCDRSGGHDVGVPWQSSRAERCVIALVAVAMSWNAGAAVGIPLVYPRLSRRRCRKSWHEAILYMTIKATST